MLVFHTRVPLLNDARGDRHEVLKECCTPLLLRFGSISRKPRNIALFAQVSNRHLPGGDVGMRAVLSCTGVPGTSTPRT